MNTTVDPSVTNAEVWDEAVSPYMAAACVWYRFTISVVIATLLTVFGLFGNFVSGLVMWRDKDKSATALLLLALAVVDSLVLLLRGIMKQVPVLCQMTNSCHYYLLIYTTYMRAYAWVFNSTNLMVNTYIVVAVTVQRYIAVCWPLKASTLASVKVAKIQIVGIIVSATIFNIPRICEFIVITVPVAGTNETTLKRIKTELGQSFPFAFGYNVISDSVVMYVVPLTILVTLNIFLVRALRQATQKRSEMKRTGNPNEEQRKQIDDREITKSLIVVVIVFVICQITPPVRRLLAAVLGGNENQCGTFYYFYHDIHNLASVVNAAANFVIYCWCGIRFRRIVKFMLCKRATVGPESTSVQPSTNETA